MKYGLIGHPVGHSFSKVIHGMLGNDSYEIADVLQEQLATFLKKKEYVGLNVTLPYKQDVISYLDEVEALALEIGAVNTIVNQNGRLKGYNTDYYGFRALVLRHLSRKELVGKKVVIFGTGGTSKTVAKVFADLGVEKIYKVSRNPEGTEVVSMQEAAKLQAEIVVNTTPVGMYPEVEGHCIAEEYREEIYKCATLCLDVVYRPIKTAFVSDALKRGIAAEGGLYMLVGQAVYAAGLFAGKQFELNLPEDEKMSSKGEDCLEELWKTVDEVYEKMQEYLQNELHICMTEKLQNKDTDFTPVMKEACENSTIVIEGKNRLQGMPEVPPSKSYSHRHLILAAMAGRESVLHDVGKSQDICVTIEGLKALGAKVHTLCEDEMKQTIRVDGTNFLKEISGEEIYCRESGSSLRFLFPLALLTKKSIRFTGEAGLLRRPMEIYEEICEKQKIMYRKDASGITVCGDLCAGVYQVQGDISSQFVTGLLFALSLLQEDSRIEIIPPIESLPYIDMTIDVMKQWGINVNRTENVIDIPGGQQAHAGEYTIEKDYSNGAYLWAYKMLEHEINVTGLEQDTLQGDGAFYDIFDRIANEMHPTIAMEQTPDLVPIAMTVAAYYTGAIFTGTRRLALKESDRGAAMVQELKKFGIDCVHEENQIEVPEGNLQTPQEVLYGHSDHRIVMALAALASVTGGQIKGYEAVKKSFPTYFDELEKCGLKVLK